MHNHSYENELNLHVNEISFSYEKMGTKTRFEEEAKGNSEVAYSNVTILGIGLEITCNGGSSCGGIYSQNENTVICF